MKIDPKGHVDWLKAHLVAKGYTHIYGQDYNDTFSLVTKMSYIHLFLSITTMHSWPLFQLDIKNVFLHHEFQEEIYMD